MTTDTAVMKGVLDKAEYVLRLRGDSMADAGMLDGDLLAVAPADTASDGEIVVALVDGTDATVKRWRVGSDGTVWLEPANALYEPVRGDVRVIGRVVGLTRDLG